MGLDWVLNRKFIDEHLDEGVALEEEYYQATSDRKKELRKLMDAISISPYEVIGCPRVGRDAAATEWLRADHAANPGGLSWEEALKECDGIYIGELAATQDGFGEVIGIATTDVGFRGNVLRHCSSTVGGDLIGEAYKDMTADKMLEYADKLEAAAKKSAELFSPEIKGIAEALMTGNKEYLPKTYNFPEYPLRNYLTIYQACKWLRFWANKGFSMWAWY
jgi:hypothetical protein